MQEAIPYKSFPPIHTKTSLINPPSNNQPIEAKGCSSNSQNMKKMVSENAVIVICRRGCCMGHVVIRLLLLGHCVNPAVYEVDEEDEVDVLVELEEMIRNDVGVDGIDKEIELPSVFIGGKLLGGLDKVIASHISEELVPVLKQAGALWL